LNYYGVINKNGQDGYGLTKLELQHIKLKTTLDTHDLTRKPGIIISSVDAMVKTDQDFLICKIRGVAISGTSNISKINNKGSVCEQALIPTEITDTLIESILIDADVW
jgi:hypothetical protein